MKKLILSAMMSVFLLGSVSVMAQDTTKKEAPKKDKTECAKGTKSCDDKEKKGDCSKEKAACTKGEKKSCCSKDKK